MLQRIEDMIETINKTTNGKGLPMYDNPIDREVYLCVRERTISCVYNAIWCTLEAFEDIEG